MPELSVYQAEKPEFTSKLADFLQIAAAASIRRGISAAAAECPHTGTHNVDF